ncbi:MAG: tetratricopeptide repeat protein, partial [Desulfatiglandaceae bacterium]
FEVQDEITMRIITALQVKLTEGEQARISGNATDNLEAYLKELQAREHFFRMNKQGSMRARELAREAIELDPDYTAPHVMLALTHMMDLWFRFTDSPEESMKLAVEAAEKALAMDDTDPMTYVGLCMLYIMQRQHDEAIAAAERAIELSPSGASAHNALGTALSFSGRHEEAIVFLKKAISLNPFPPTIYFRGLANAYRMAGQCQEAITEYKRTLQQNPDDLFAHLGLAVAYVSLGRQEAARAEAEEVLRIHPRFSVEHHSNTLPFKNKADTELYIDALRKAWLK